MDLQTLPARLDGRKPGSSVFAGCVDRAKPSGSTPRLLQESWLALLPKTPGYCSMAWPGRPHIKDGQMDA